MWFLILMAAAYIAVNFFLWHRTVRFLRHIHGFLGRMPVIAIFTVIYVFLMSSVASWALLQDPDWGFAMKYLSNVWTGVMIYALFFVAIAEIVTFALWAAKKMRRGYGGYRRFLVVRGAVVVLLVTVFSLYGLMHAGSLKVTEYDAKVDKSLMAEEGMSVEVSARKQATTEADDKLRIVLVADTHIGYSVGEEHIAKMVSLINEQEPDLVCIAGDIVDNDYYAIKNPQRIQDALSKIKSKYGVYACFGNHDVEEKLIGGFTVSLQKKTEIQPQVYDFLEAAGIHVLQDEAVNIGENIILIGRLDRTKPNVNAADEHTGTRKSIAALTAGLDKNKLIIDMDHQPSELENKAAAGVDIDLGGHTHDGQIFPGNLTINLFWDNPCGMIKVGDMYSIVTSGVGVWGPAMRVGTDGEVVVVNVR